MAFYGRIANPKNETKTFLCLDRIKIDWIFHMHDVQSRFPGASYRRILSFLDVAFIYDWLRMILWLWLYESKFKPSATYFPLAPQLRKCYFKAYMLLHCIYVATVFVFGKWTDALYRLTFNPNTVSVCFAYSSKIIIILTYEEFRVFKLVTLLQNVALAIQKESVESMYRILLTVNEPTHRLDTSCLMHFIDNQECFEWQKMTFNLYLHTIHRNMKCIPYHIP